MLKMQDVNYGPLEKAKTTEQATAFLVHLLVKDEEKRPNAAEAIQHLWITNNEKRKVKTKGGREVRKAKKSIESYVNASHFSKAAMNCIASQVDHSQITELTEMFERMDTNHDGTLSADELEKGLADLGIEKEPVQQIVDALDVNCNGSIEYSEFVACLLQTQRHLIENVLYHTFHIFDVNHDNLISVEELRLMLSGEGPLVSLLPDGETVEDLLAQMDTSHDGEVNFSEYKNFMLNQLFGKPSPTPKEGGEELLSTVFRRISALLGRDEMESKAWADRLLEQHWLQTVADLKPLRESDWAQLGLPLKFQCLLRVIVEGRSLPSFAQVQQVQSTLPTPSLLGTPSIVPKALPTSSLRQAQAKAPIGPKSAWHSTGVQNSVGYPGSTFRGPSGCRPEGGSDFSPASLLASNHSLQFEPRFNQSSGALPFAHPTLSLSRDSSRQQRPVPISLTSTALPKSPSVHRTINGQQIA